MSLESKDLDLQHVFVLYDLDLRNSFLKYQNYKLLITILNLYCVSKGIVSVINNVQLRGPR